ncbi:MAG: acyl-CoA dehydrogenase [Deltaproteobacteria bacterium]|nr:MAG: acyl-CoA dehydrogenase [Deltaproteobacteria bacterium]
MSNKLVNERDLQFVLWEQLELEKILDHEAFGGVSRDDHNMIIEQISKFAEEVLLPINLEGDEVGCKYDDGEVKIPKCYHDAFKAFKEAGWMGLSAPPEYGGQGLSQFATLMVSEFLNGANVSFSIYPGLTSGAAAVIEEYGTQEQKDRYLKKMYAGDWGGTMDLTEDGAGSAVGDLKTKAKKVGDKWLIEGTKQFITAAENDMVENIIHLVLARAEGSPPGIKGISLFIVPKFRVNPDGSLGEFNDLRCTGIEEKMGLHGSATCALLFGDEGKCEGELLGEVDKGIIYMFKLMNHARLGTGLQGLAAASTAYLASLQYAKERVQGVEIKNMRDVNAPRVEIIKHPDVRRMLLKMKAYIEGMRAVLYRAAYLAAMGMIAEDTAEREKYNDMFEVFTPVIKAYFSDTGFLLTSDAVQVHGGYGYCKEYKVEQLMRDSKIASIFEGTNGIQALDLVGRKVFNLKKQMKPYNDLIAELRKFIEDNKGHPTLAAFIEKAGDAIETLDTTTQHLVNCGMSGDQEYPVIVATPYLKLFGDVLVGWQLCDQLIIADRKLNEIYEKEGAGDDAAKAKLVEDNNEAAFYSGKCHAAKFYLDTLLCQVKGDSAYITSNNRSVVEIPENAF